MKRIKKKKKLSVKSCFFFFFFFFLLTLSITKTATPLPRSSQLLVSFSPLLSLLKFLIFFSLLSSLSFSRVSWLLHLSTRVHRNSYRRLCFLRQNLHRRSDSLISSPTVIFLLLLLLLLSSSTTIFLVTRRSRSWPKGFLTEIVRRENLISLFHGLFVTAGSGDVSHPGSQRRCL